MSKENQHSSLSQKQYSSEFSPLQQVFFYIPFTVQQPNITIVIFTNLIDKLFILIHLLHSSTCFEHYYAHRQEVKLY